MVIIRNTGTSPCLELPLTSPKSSPEAATVPRTLAEVHGEGSARKKREEVLKDYSVLYYTIRSLSSLYSRYPLPLKLRYPMPSVSTTHHLALGHMFAPRLEKTSVRGDGFYISHETTIKLLRADVHLA